MEKEVFHIDEQTEKMLAVQTQFGARVNAVGYTEENIFTLESNDPAWPLPRIKEEYGLENFRDYHARAERAQQSKRSFANLPAMETR